jgi:hypothetical protein
VVVLVHQVLRHAFNAPSGLVYLLVAVGLVAAAVMLAALGCLIKAGATLLYRE